MDFSESWKQFLSECPDITAGAFLSADGVEISSTAFDKLLAECAAMVAIAYQLTEDTQRGEFEAIILEGKQGYIVLTPFLDKAILAGLVRKDAKLGLVLLEMRRAIDELFGPGLVAEPLSNAPSPHRRTAYAAPD